MYGYLTKYIDEIEHLGFEQAGPLDKQLAYALDNPKIDGTGYGEHLDDFLAKVGQGTIADIDEGYRTNMGGGLSIAGWRELVAQLAFMRAVGRL